MKALFILNDPPQGTEHVDNALRLAHALLKQDATAVPAEATVRADKVRVF